MAWLKDEHKFLLTHLNFIIDYKIDNDQPFGNIETIFEYASDSDKERLLFHLAASSVPFDCGSAYSLPVKIP